MRETVKVFGLSLLAAAAIAWAGPSNGWGDHHEDLAAEFESDGEIHGDDEGAGAAHGGNANPLSVDPDLAIFTAIVFVLLLAVLGKFAWGPICEALDERERGIENQITGARQANEEAQGLLKEHQSKLAAAADEVRGILDEAKKDAESRKQRIVDDAQQAATAEKERAVREINAAKDGALSELAEKSIDTAVGLAGQIVSKELDKQDHQELVQQALEKFPS